MARLGEKIAINKYSGMVRNQNNDDSEYKHSIFETRLGVAPNNLSRMTFE